jgi:protein phosphatase
MEIHIHRPLAFSEVGERSTNEDFVYPPPGLTTADDRLFMVCDGIGGADKGEEASRIVGEQVAAYFRRHGQPMLSETGLRAALQEAYQGLHQFMQEHTLVSRMGTTLALLQLNAAGASVAHLGDSRVYHVGRGRVKFCTTDHKQVYELVEAGIITAEQAKTHPWRNRLSRAILASGSSAENRAGSDLPDVTHLTDVEAGDYFFLCTDGVLEHLTETHLVAILNTDAPEEDKLAQLLAVCQHRTKDNFSGYLVRVKSV